jgi:hypothetical protein
MTNLNTFAPLFLLTLTTAPVETKIYFNDKDFSHTTITVHSTVGYISDIKEEIFSEAFQCMLASEDVLAKEWSDPEEAKAWADL